ncbi:hypothetical protein ABZX85_21770 [Streptomyces sp. NPDC004539]|uniref:hypothetical protein n=1 Tax=Streptomyces sp. NPDC004539 TaxID=3154280 RepID=UPI0033B1EDC9
MRELAERVALLDAALRPVAERPVDFTNPEWAAELGQDLGPWDDADALLAEIIDRYDTDDDATRAALRALLARHPSFRWATTSPRDPTPEGFRRRLLHLSLVDHGHDTRDELLTLWDLCRQAREAGVDLTATLREVAELSSGDDRYGMGSMRDILRGAAAQA